MTIENRFALVTVRIPLSEMTTEEEMNAWSPADWPRVIADLGEGLVASHGYEIVSSKMEGDLYKPDSYTFYTVWHIMGSMIAQYIEFPKERPTVKEIQAEMAKLQQAVMLTYEKAGQPLEGPPQDIVLFFFGRVDGRQNDAIPDDAEWSEGGVDGANEVDKSVPGRNLRRRKPRRTPLN